ncbi:MAG TPA: hypothetical protein PKW33_05985 [Anaerolineaceae bacterium]|nr:hypothetical protein [Anaerolineaceae bacterium]HPN51117.1 hypothetical protein [Anaerolineaceae bacterium]
MPVEILKCPNCNAPLNSAEPVSKCPYCNSLIRVTQEEGFGMGNGNSAILEEVKRLAQAGKKIEAIKLFREKTGVGLAEAKLAVEAIEKWSGVPGVPIQISQTVTAIRGESSEWMREIVELLRQGRKLEAIELFREKTHTGLREATMVVETIEGRILSGSEPLIIQTDGAETGGSSGWMAQIQELMRQGKKIEAIKIYRQHTYVGLKEAKDAVERMEGDAGFDHTFPQSPPIPQSSAIEDLDASYQKSARWMMIGFILVLLLMLLGAGVAFILWTI